MQVGIGILNPSYIAVLEGTARYVGLLLTSSEGFGLRLRLVLPFGYKISFYAVFDHFMQFFVFCSNLSNLEKIQKIPQKNVKESNKSENPKFWEKKI